ncbi:MAG: phosphoglucosamine mutase [Pseudomonadota bacterium]|nr:phosphoglucosamine mutase [Pseudomonadota bacterium]
MSAPNIKKAVQEAELLLKNRGRVLLRPSGTESVVRVMVEGNKLSEVQSIANKLAETVKISVK